MVSRTSAIIISLLAVGMALARMVKTWLVLVGLALIWVGTEREPKLGGKAAFMLRTFGYVIIAVDVLATYFGYPLGVLELR